MRVNLEAAHSYATHDNAIAAGHKMIPQGLRWFVAVNDGGRFVIILVPAREQVQVAINIVHSFNGKVYVVG